MGYNFDGSVLADDSVVTFETVFNNGKEAAMHNDSNDEVQTVDIPKAETTLTVDSTEVHIAKVSEKMSLTDVAEYENLSIGKEYTVTGVQMDKTTRKILITFQRQAH